MKSRKFLGAVFAIVLLLLAASSAFAGLSGLSLPVWDDNGTPELEDDTVTGIAIGVTLTGLPPRCRDIHIFPANGTMFPPLAGGGSEQGINVSGKVPDPQSETGGTKTEVQPWKVRRRSTGGSKKKGYHLYSGPNSAGFVNGLLVATLTFKKPIPRAEWNRLYQTATFKATSNGLVNFLDTDVVGQSGVPNGLGLPQMTIAANGGADPLVTVGGTTVISCSGDPVMSDQPYEIYTSLSLDPDCEDVLEIGINSETDPVPAAWQLGFNDATGDLDGTGTPQMMPSITVPANAGLTGKTFYFVFAVKSGSPAVIDYSSDPILVTIQ